ncbi:MAG: hypothetical protein J6V03_06700 [Clostridia bacterium]|nr:hypothetical protein [Clostridia bacterium]
MSWKNIKTFLIVLFLIINVYLVYSQYGFGFKSSGASYINKDTLNDAIGIIEKNHNVKLDKSIIPSKVKKLGIIDVTNIIYTDEFKNSKYTFETNGAGFKTHIETQTYSYYEENAKNQFVKILSDIGIEKPSFNVEVKKTDEGLVCEAYGLIEPYKIFNGKIKAIFTPRKINLFGNWYIAEEGILKKHKPKEDMADIPTVIIDVSSRCVKSDGTQTCITEFEYGYFVSSYDEQSASKTSSAIPCYMIKTDDGIKYYYDSLNGNLLKQEA